ncbi:MAG TPA: DUF3418 domain-containing protein, partial [Syntrophales bacterium]|nr:DUF3418 domain-containing protein [Syntrophales bacterium]
EADEKHAAFADPSSDFMTLLRIWNKYHSLARSGASKGQLRRFCRDNYLSARRMNDWVDVCEQLESILQDHGWKMGRTRDGDLKNAKDLYDGIHKSILSGFLSNIAVRKEKNNYAAAKGRDAMLFPGSTLWGKGGGWIVAAEMIETSRLFARMAANVDVAWLEELGGSLCRTTYSEPHWGRERGEVAAYEQVTLFGLTIVERRRVSYGRINPDESSEIFIRSALIEGDVRRPLPFMLHNLKMREKVSAMEDKIRRRNLLAGEDQILLFYKKRLPGIYDMRTLQKLIRDKGGDAFLRMKEEDILARTPDVDELAPYPDHVTLDSHSFTCHYRYEPGHPEDGVTVKVPVHMLSTIPPEATDWMVPGLTREKIAVLLKGLPKEYRKKLQPLSQTCDIIMDEVREAAQPLVSVLGRFIERRFGVNIPSSLWNTDALENRLDPRFSITDDKGRELAAGRDIRSLQRDAVGRAQSDAFDRAKRIWEKTRLTTWDFGDLPYAVSLQGISGYAYPALEPNEGFANLRLYENKQEAIKSHRGGVSVLYRNYFKEELKYLKKAIALPPDMKKWADPIGGAKAMESIILEKLVFDLFSKDIRSQDDFFSYTREVKGRILPAGQDILNVLRPCLRSYYETLQALRRLAAANRMNRPALAYLDYLAEELRGLMPKDFLLRYGTDRLARIMTYLKALAIRAERGIAHVDRALAKTEEANIFSDSLRDMISNKSTASEEKLRLIEEYRWMIEEYKVSLFAQELKTPSPVSRKRLENKRQEIERII